MCHQEQGISWAVLPFLGIQAGHGGAVALTNGISGLPPGSLPVEKKTELVQLNFMKGLGSSSLFCTPDDLS